MYLDAGRLVDDGPLGAGGLLSGLMMGGAGAHGGLHGPSAGMLDLIEGLHGLHGGMQGAGAGGRLSGDTAGLAAAMGQHAAALSSSSFGPSGFGP